MSGDRSSNPSVDYLRELMEWKANATVEIERLTKDRDAWKEQHYRLVETVTEWRHECERLRALLLECDAEFLHSHVFIKTREKMHPEGVKLYEALQVRVLEALGTAHETDAEPYAVGARLGYQPFSHWTPSALTILKSRWQPGQWLYDVKFDSGNTSAGCPSDFMVPLPADKTAGDQ